MAGATWRRLDFDRTHFFTQSYIYEVPFGKDKKYLQSGPGAWLLGGWQVNGVLQIATGAPIDFVNGSAVAGILNAPGKQQYVQLVRPWADSNPAWHGPEAAPGSRTRFAISTRPRARWSTPNVSRRPVPRMAECRSSEISVPNFLQRSRLLERRCVDVPKLRYE